MNLRCVQCGYARPESAFDTYECVMCGNKMESTREQATETVEGVLPDYFEEAIESDIRELGNDQTWLAIEKLNSLSMRLQYRKMFFKVGGYVPNSEVVL